MSSKQYSIRLILNNSTEWEYIIKERVTKEGVLDSHKEAISASKPIPNNRLQIATQIDFPKFRTFLESVARGSKNSKSSYEIGLKVSYLKDSTHYPWINTPFLNSEMNISLAKL